MSAGLSACGPQVFVPSAVTSAQTSPGGMNIPPKVDIVMGISQNGTMKNIYTGINQEIPAFIQGLQTSGWDYRFVTIPLSQYMPGSNPGFAPVAKRVSVSQYDATYHQYGSWISPYPGADPSNPALSIFNSLFSPTFQIVGEDPAHNDGHETGLQNEMDFLNRADVNMANNPDGTNQGFLRPDAVLAVITLSNGTDTSGGSWGPVWNGTGWSPTDTNFLNNFRSSLLALKSNNASLLKYFSLVAHNTTVCRGYNSWPGSRYEQITSMINQNTDCTANGTCIDICNTQLSSALSSVAQNLQSARLSFEKNYLVIGSEPDVGSIIVNKIHNGVSTKLAQDSNNGWTYEGYLTNQPTIDAPIAMANATGYMIKLHGSATLIGDDSSKITYTNNGATISQ